MDRSSFQNPYQHDCTRTSGHFWLLYPCAVLEHLRGRGQQHVVLGIQRFYLQASYYVADSAPVLICSRYHCSHLSLLTFTTL